MREKATQIEIALFRKEFQSMMQKTGFENVSAENTLAIYKATAGAIISKTAIAKSCERIVKLDWGDDFVRRFGESLACISLVMGENFGQVTYDIQLYLIHLAAAKYHMDFALDDTLLFLSKTHTGGLISNYISREYKDRIPATNRKCLNYLLPEDSNFELSEILDYYYSAIAEFIYPFFESSESGEFQLQRLCPELFLDFEEIISAKDRVKGEIGRPHSLVSVVDEFDYPKVRPFGPVAISLLISQEFYQYAIDSISEYKKVCASHRSDERGMLDFTKEFEKRALSYCSLKLRQRNQN